MSSSDSVAIAMYKSGSDFGYGHSYFPHVQAVLGVQDIAVWVQVRMTPSFAEVLAVRKKVVDQDGVGVC